MKKEQVLQRGLGLTSIFAISMGAMIGSGIFILPGLAMAETGPAVIIAFVLAGLLVFPAAISISELGTAMPDAGGDYIFIERGLGPGAGTIAGLGTWLMLMFKGALALVGGMFYLTVLIDLPSIETVAVIIGTILILVNTIGVKQTGGLQTVMVVVMVIILAVFVMVSLPSVEESHFRPFLTGGGSGLISATVMVLISYGGVTKVAAVAEEIQNPGRNLPLGLMLSLIVTTILYALIVYVLVGIVDGEQLAGSNIPMVDAVEPNFGTLGVILIVIAAMLALVSTANAGILTASRYPFALSRDKLIPELFARVNRRFHTPVTAILVTGGAMLAIILLLPVEEIAKTAGSFQIVVYILVNIALIAFRVRKPDWYDPDFKSPLYPWIQIFGIISGVFILSQMDTLPLIGGVGILVLGTAWYLFYGRQRVDREGIIGEAIAKQITTAPGPDQPYRIILPIANPRNQRQLLRLAMASASTRKNVEIVATSVLVVPSQTSLAQEVLFEDERIRRHEELLEEVSRTASDLDLIVRTVTVVGRSVPRVVLNMIQNEHASEVILGWKGKKKRRKAILGTIIDPIVKKAPCRVTLLKPGSEQVGKVVAFVGTGPHTIATVRRAGDVARSESGTSLTLVNIQKPDPSESPEHQTKRGELLIENTARKAGLTPDEFDSRVLLSSDIETTLLATAETFETVCIGATRSTLLERALFGSFPEYIGEHADSTVMIVRDQLPSLRSFREVLRRYFWPRSRTDA